MRARFHLDFLVLGAQKAGTTTLHSWLERSPAVALPWTKETHFFRDEDKFSRGVDWYSKQFKSINYQSDVIGEIDPDYMYFPECAERIKSLTTTPKLIIVLRDPLSRARSHYQMSLRRAYERLSFVDALFAEKDRLRAKERFSLIHHSYIDRGLYSRQIERIYEVFPSSKILVLLFDDIFSSQFDANLSLKRLCEFIGVNHNGLSIDVSVQKNHAAEARFIPVRDFIYGQNIIKKMIGKLIPSREMKIKMTSFLDRLNMKTTSRTVPNTGTKNDSIPSFVYEVFIQDLHKLQTLVNIDLSSWIDGYEERVI